MQGLLQRIVSLWEELHIPLMHRSRFYLAFRGREMFYFDAEKRRLEYLKNKMGNPEDPNPALAQKARREYGKQIRKLEVSQDSVD